MADVGIRLSHSNSALEIEVMLQTKREVEASGTEIGLQGEVGVKS